MNFADFNLSQSVLQAIEENRFKAPTKVQEAVIPTILEGRDVVVKAKTGSGKTSAFAIPIIEKLDLAVSTPKVLVITPTRELADQVCNEITSLGNIKAINAMAVYGKKSIQVQIEQLQESMHILVGTPGRLNDLIRRKALILDSIDYLVLDEADELVNRGFFDEIIDIIHELPKTYQTLLFSATMPVQVKDLCEAYMKDAHWIEIEEDAPSIKELNYLVDEKLKFLKLRESIATINPYTCIIFCNTQLKVEELYNRMKQVGVKPLKLHGGLKQRERLKAIESFKQGDYQCLIATDLIARGIHIDSLDLVINYDIPEIAENYVHRIGRTGRVSESGLAVTLFTSNDTLHQEALEEYLGRTFDLIEVNGSNLDCSLLTLSKSEERLLAYKPK